MIKKLFSKNVRPRRTSLRSGFTFIELLVTVTIIIIISVGGMVVFSGSSKKARDSKRRADLEKIRTALELFRQENGIYPDIPNQNWSASPANGLLSRYLDTWPTDPSGTGYGYCKDTAYTYRVAACFELDPASGSAAACAIPSWQILTPSTCAVATVGGTNAVVLTNP